MSRRPRLVEEGKPIDPTTLQDSSTDDFLESEYRKAAQKEQEERHPARDHRISRTGISTLPFFKHEHPVTTPHYDTEAMSCSSLEHAAAHLSSPAAAAGGGGVQGRPPPRTSTRHHHTLQTKIEIGGEDVNKKPARSSHAAVGQEPPLVPRRKLVTKIEIVENNPKQRERKYSDDSSTSMMDVDHVVEHGIVSSLSSSLQPVVPSPFMQTLSTVENNNDLYDDPSERMEIDDTHLQRLPLVVLDGANVAYAYSQATETSSSLSNGAYISSSSSGGNKNGLVPNVLGIQIAVSYFLHGGCRVQVVVPVYWMRRKPGNGSSSHVLGNASQLDILNRLKEQNILCCSPPTDDDDAYCISIARRIDARFEARKKTSSSLQVYAMSHFSNFDDDLTKIGGAYILSNDLFRDAQDRDLTGDLTRWLDGDEHEGAHCSLPRRISYSFADLGSMNQYGDGQLDFVPNPRHPLIAMIERSHRKNGTTY